MTPASRLVMRRTPRDPRKLWIMESRVRWCNVYHPIHRRPVNRPKRITIDGVRK